VKSLTGRPGEYRLRVGSWRVLFELAEGDVIVVYRVAPRGSAYQP
jgi:mRNA-degrading endonuclease RelE of RelBE toxin-antitoxin system